MAVPGFSRTTQVLRKPPQAETCAPQVCSNKLEKSTLSILPSRRLAARTPNTYLIKEHKTRIPPQINIRQTGKPKNTQNVHNKPKKTCCRIKCYNHNDRMLRTLSKRYHLAAFHLTKLKTSELSRSLQFMYPITTFLALYGKHNEEWHDVASCSAAILPEKHVPDTRHDLRVPFTLRFLLQGGAR